MNPFARTYVAVALLGAVAAYIYFVERPRGDDPVGQSEKVFSFSEEAVTSLRVEPKGGDALEARRDGGEWRLVAPLEAAADRDEVEAIVGDLARLELRGTVVVDPADVAPFGLDAPPHSVSITLDDGATLALAVGDETPDTGLRYAQVTGDRRVIAVPSTIAATLDKNPFDLRDRRLWRLDRTEMRRLQIAGPAGGYALERFEEREEWGIVEPLRTQAGRWAVSSLLGDLEGLKMEAIIAETASPDELIASGLAHPDYTVEIVLEGGATHTLTVGSGVEGEEQYHARLAADDRIVSIPKRVVDTLSKGVDEIRAKRLMDIASFEVRDFAVEFEDTTRLYKRIDDDAGEAAWRRVEPDEADVSRSDVDDFLFDFGGLDVARFVDAPEAPERYGLDAPTLAVTLRRGEDKPVLRVVVSRGQDAVYATRPDDDAVLVVADEGFEKLLGALRKLF